MTGNWTAIVINYNGAGFIEACLLALESCNLRPAEIIVVDNASTDESLLELNGYPRAIVLPQTRNLGFAGGANVGLQAVETDFAVIFNPDVEVYPAFGDELLKAFEADSRLGAAGPLLLYPDEQTIQHAGGRVERPLMTTSHYLYGESLTDITPVARDVEFVTGGAIALRMDAVRGVSGFDTSFSPVYYEDVDLCLRLQSSGWSVRFIPELRAIHHEGVTLQREPAYYHFLHRNRVQFAARHLSSIEWSKSFVPAEIERLRWELQHVEHDDWMTVSGANAVENLLREPDGWSSGSGLLPAASLDCVKESVDEARDSWEVSAGNVKPAGVLSRLAVRMFSGLGPRQYLDAVLSDQRAFNAAVVRALEAQERTNRELLATQLLLAIDLIGRMQRDGQLNPPGDSPER